jgi:hypothetical protein
LTKEVAFKNERLVIQAFSTDGYANDRVALKTDYTFDVMGRNAMPQSLFRTAWKDVRDYLVQSFNVTSFDEAYLQFAAKYFSPINIIANYAVISDHAHRYDVIFPRDPAAYGVPTIAWNLPRRPDLQAIGCCRVYGIGCKPEYLNDTAHLVEPFLSRETVRWLHIEDTVRLYYENVRLRLASLPESEVETMRSYCEQMKM